MNQRPPSFNADEDPDMLARNIDHCLRGDIDIRWIGDEYEPPIERRREIFPLPNLKTTGEQFLKTDGRRSSFSVYHCSAGKAELVTEHMADEMSAVIVRVVGVADTADLADMLSH